MGHTTYYPPSGVYADSYRKDIRIIKTRRQRLLAIGALIFLFALPLIPGLNSSYLLRLYIGVGIAVIICLGLNILTGYCGQLNIGQSAFVMVGAFTSGLLSQRLGWPFWACVVPAPRRNARKRTSTMWRCGGMGDFGIGERGVRGVE